MPTVVLPVTLDTFIIASNPTNSLDTEVYIGTGEDNTATGAIRRSIIQCSGLTDGTIPATATITSAILTLTVHLDTSTNARTHRWYRMIRPDIDITTATWNIYKTGSNWGTAGGFNATDCEQTDICSKALANNLSVNSAQDFTLTTSAIQEIVRGTWGANFLLGKADTELNDGYTWHSSEASTAGYRPYITVIYTLAPYRTHRGINLLGRHGRRLVY